MARRDVHDSHNSCGKNVRKIILERTQRYTLFRLNLRCIRKLSFNYNKNNYLDTPHFYSN